MALFRYGGIAPRNGLVQVAGAAARAAAEHFDRLVATGSKRVEGAVVTEAVVAEYERSVIGIVVDCRAGCDRTPRRLREDRVERGLRGQVARRGGELRGDDEAATRVVWVEPAVGIEAAIGLIDRVALGPLHPDHDVAAVVEPVHAHEGADTRFRAVTLEGITVLDIDVQPLEILLEDEVDDTRQGVRTVHCGGAACDGLDTLHCELWNRVDVDGVVRVPRLAAAAIDHHQVAVGAQAAQVQGDRARSECGGALDTVGELRVLRHELRLLIENDVEADRRVVVELVLAEGDDRAGCLEVARARNARARDRDLGEPLIARVRCHRTWWRGRSPDRGRHGCRN